MRYRIRFNKLRGQPGRGSFEHVWRVFEGENREYLARHFKLNVPSWSEMDANGVDYNLVCEGVMEFFNDTDTVIINAV